MKLGKISAIGQGHHIKKRHFWCSVWFHFVTVISLVNHEAEAIEIHEAEARLSKI